MPDRQAIREGSGLMAQVVTLSMSDTVQASDVATDVITLGVLKAGQRIERYWLYNEDCGTTYTGNIGFPSGLGNELFPLETLGTAGEKSVVDSPIASSNTDRTIALTLTTVSAPTAGATYQLVLEIVNTPGRG